MSESAVAPKAAMVIEDSVHNRNIVVHLLQALGFEVQSFENADVAEEALIDIPAHELQIVFCDIMMPGIGGLEFCRRLRSKADYKNTQIVMITAVSDSHAVMEAKKIGVQSYLLKPLSGKRIVLTLTKLLPHVAMEKDVLERLMAV